MRTTLVILLLLTLPSPAVLLADTPGGSPKDKDTETASSRMQRWRLRFVYANGEEYAEELHALGAYLAVPTDDGKYLLYRDLRPRPAPCETVSREELNDLDRISWVNLDQQAISILGMTLGWKPLPKRFEAFFPKNVEDDLAKKETTYAKKRSLEEIKQTIFTVSRRGWRIQAFVTNQQYTR